jgi:hypothetical protein
MHSKKDRTVLAQNVEVGIWLVTSWDLGSAAVLRRRTSAIVVAENPPRNRIYKN